jgi:carbohydrate-binding DOMON domain-containing protein
MVTVAFTVMVTVTVTVTITVTVTVTAMVTETVTVTVMVMGHLYLLSWSRILLYGYGNVYWSVTVMAMVNN